MVVFLQQFREVKPAETLGSVVGLGDRAVQEGRPELIPFLFGKAAFGGHFTVVIRGMVQPLLTVGQAMASFIDDHCCGLRQVIEQRRRL